MKRSFTAHLDPDNDTETEIILRRATIADGIRRRILTIKNVTGANKYLQHIKDEVYPICVACVESPVFVKEMTFDTFQELLETETDLWFELALELNPHWSLDIRLDAAAEEKKWNIEDWLRESYDNPEAESGAMPPFEEKVFMLGRMSDELIERAKKLLAVLELTEFRWTILDIMEQPEEDLDAVFYMKSIGEKMRTQRRLKNKS